MRLGGFHLGPPAALSRWTSGPRSLVDGPIIPAILVFSLPLLLTNLLHALAGTWAAIWVSHVLGEGALVAVVNTNVFFFMMMGTIMGVGAASGIAIGQSVGRDNMQDVKRIAGTSVAFAGIAATLIASLGAAFAPNLVDLINLPQASRGYAIVFLRMTCLVMPSLFVFIFLMMMMRGCGDSTTPFKYSVVWISLTLLLGPLFLTGYGIFPKLGIAGIALGNLIGNWLALIAMLRHVYRHDLPIALRGEELRFLRPDPALLAMLVKRGLPMGAETIIVQGAYFVLLGMVNAYGVVAAAAYAGAAQLWGYVQMPAMALATSLSSMAAQNIGANLWHRVDLIAFRGCLLSVLITAATAVLILSLGELPLMLFLPNGGESLAMAQDINEIVLWSWSILAVTASLLSIVRANGAMIPATIVFALTMWAFRVPFAYYFEPVMGMASIWWSFPVGTIMSAAFAMLYFKYGGWCRRKLMMESIG
jgi:putative MATE family efflux protein